MDPNSGNFQNELFDVSNIFHALDVKVLIKSIAMFLKVKQETVAEWMMEFVLDLKRCHYVLKTASGKIYELKDNVISLQGTKLQKQEQLLEENSRAVKFFQSTLTAEMKSYRDVTSTSSVVTPENIV